MTNKEIKLQKEAEQVKYYLANKKECDDSIIISAGMLLSVYEHIERANKVAPKVFSNKLLFVLEESIAAIYPKGTPGEIGDAHYEVCTYYDKCNNNFINKRSDAKKP